jgi:hypothetical protein
MITLPPHAEPEDAIPKIIALFFLKHVAIELVDE